MNKLANVYFRIQKLHTAQIHYEKSLQSMISPFIPRFGLQRNLSRVFLNMGLLSMKNQQYLDGYYFLAIASILSPAFLQKEVVLLRLAECCIQFDRVSEEEKQLVATLQRYPIAIQNIASSALKQRFILKCGVKDKPVVNLSSAQAEKEFNVLMTTMLNLSESDKEGPLAFLTNCSLSSAVVLLERGYAQFLKRDPKLKGIFSHHSLLDRF